MECRRQALTDNPLTRRVLTSPGLNAVAESSRKQSRTRTYEDDEEGEDEPQQQSGPPHNGDEAPLSRNEKITMRQVSAVVEEEYDST